MNRWNRKETIKEYDKRVWGDFQIVLGYLAFIGLCYFLVDFFNIGV